MATVFDFSKGKRKKEENDLKDLNTLLKRARHLIVNESTSSRSSILRVTSKEHFIRKLEGGISKEIIGGNLVSRGLFLCGVYVPKVIARYLSKPPESWVAVDYLNNGDDEKKISLQEGADVCFLICCLFPGRGNWRLMNIGYYQKMGTSFYYRFYQKTGKEIGYHMSDNFDQIVNLASQSVKSL